MACHDANDAGRAAYLKPFYPTWDAAEGERLRRVFDLRDEQRISRMSKGEAGKLMMLLALVAVFPAIRGQAAGRRWRRFASGPAFIRSLSWISSI